MSSKPTSTSSNDCLINFDSEEDLLKKHPFEIEKKVRFLPEASSDIQKNVTLSPNIINTKSNSITSIPCTSFYSQGECNNGESSHIFRSSGYFEDFDVSHSSNLRNSTPKYLVGSHSNNLQRTPEIISFSNSSCNLQSSTPKASSCLSPFASDLTKVEFVRNNIDDVNQNIEVKNFEGINSDVSNDIFEFETGMNSLEYFKKSNYEDCVESSVSVFKHRCLSTQSTSQMSTYFSANGLKTSAIDVKSPVLINEALKQPNELKTNTMNEDEITEDMLKTLNTNSYRRGWKFSPLNSSEEKYNDEVNKTCNSESLFESFDIHDSDSIYFQDNLESKPNGNSTDNINLTDASSNLNCGTLSDVHETFESTDQFASPDSLTVNNRHNESVYEIMNDVLNYQSQELQDICSPDHCTEENTCPFSDESDFLKEDFCMIDNDENLTEVSKVEPLITKTTNLNEFLTDTVEINEAANQWELNSENVNLENPCDFLKICNSSRNNIIPYHRTLGELNSKKIKTQEIATNPTPLFSSVNSGLICRKLSNLTSGIFSGTFDVCSDLSKSIQPTALLFVNSMPEIITCKKFGENSINEKSSSHMEKLVLEKLRPFKIGFEGGSNVPTRNNFKIFSGENVENIDIFNTDICKTQESTLNFETQKELKLMCNHNLSSLISSDFPQSVIIYLNKLIANKRNSQNSYYSNKLYVKSVTSKIKHQDLLSNSSDAFLKSDLFSVNDCPTAFVQNGIRLETSGSNTNSKLYDAHQMSNESKESNEDSLDNEIVFKSKYFQNASNAVTFVPMHDDTLSSQSNMFYISRLPEHISEISNNMSADNHQDTSIKSNPSFLSDSLETDISMISNSDSDDFVETSEKSSEHENKNLPLQLLFDVDKMVAKAVVQTFTDLGSRRGLKQSQILKHINQRKMIEMHSKLNQDIQNFLKISCEVGIIRRKRFRYFVSEKKSSNSRKRKGTKNKCKTPKRRETLKVESPASTKIKAGRATLEKITPTGMKTRSAFKVEILNSTKIKVKRDRLELKTPTSIKLGRAAFQVETPASARIKKLRKNSSNAKCLFSGNWKKSSVFQRSGTELGSPVIYKKLRSRVILQKNDG